jgi:predicted amidophosphoribosyltransferase
MDGPIDAGPGPLLRRLAELGRVVLDDLLFPPECAACGTSDTAAPFCPACRDELLAAAGPACPRCALPLGDVAARLAAARGGCGGCRGRALGFDGAIALGPYQGPLRRVCLRLKHTSGAWLARWAADLLVDARGEAIRDWVASEGAGAVVAPVPLHWWRRCRRGYNQAEELAARVARRLGLGLARPLRRVRPTAKLAGRGRVERAEVMRGAFRARDGGGRLRGRGVLLVDDILTTGATCGAAARALKGAGAGRVLALVLGRAEGRA